MKKVNRRLMAALACYGVLIVVALFALLPIRSSNEGFVLALVLGVFAILIVKTIAHSQDEESE